MTTTSSASRILFRLIPLGLVSLTWSGCLAVGLATRGAPASELQSFEVDLSPVDLPASRPSEGPWASGSAHSEKGLHGVIPRPSRVEVPIDGWMHGFDYDLVDAAGDEVPAEVLHHLKVISPERRELFSPLMLRIAAAGAETKPILLPSRIGYPLVRGDTLLVTAMLHNPTGTRLEGVRLRIRVRYSPEGPWRPPAEVVPFFTHVTPPLEESEYDLPPGRSRRSIEVRPAVGGRILGLGGHLHRYGTGLRLSEVETGRILWESRAERGPDGTILEIPDDVFVWSGGIEIRPDRSYRVTAFYDNPTGRVIPDGGMGTVGGVILADGPWPTVDPTAPAYRWDLERETGGGVR